TPPATPASPEIKDISYQTDGCHLTFTTQPGALYQVQYRNQLSGAWISAGSEFQADATQTSYVDTSASASAIRFYRVQASAPPALPAPPVDPNNPPPLPVDPNNPPVDPNALPVDPNNPPVPAPPARKSPFLPGAPLLRR